MKKITVTYTLLENEVKAVKELAAQNGYTFKRQFELMMTAGSKWDIEKKIKFWQEMRKNEMNKNNQSALTSP